MALDRHLEFCNELFRVFEVFYFFDNEIQKLLLTHHSLYNHCLSKAMFVHSKPNSQDLWHVQIFSKFQMPKVKSI